MSREYIKPRFKNIKPYSILKSISEIEKSKYYNPDFDLINIPFDDKKTFDVLNNGFTSGVFQLEHGGMTKALRTVKVNTFNDLSAVLALSPRF